VPAPAEPPAAAAHQPERRPDAAANGADGAGSGDPTSSPTARASGNKRPRASAEEGGDDVLVVMRRTNEVPKGFLSAGSCSGDEQGMASCCAWQPRRAAATCGTPWCPRAGLRALAMASDGQRRLQASRRTLA